MRNTRLAARLKRKLRVRVKIKGMSNCPRLSIFRSNRFIYGQIINDDSGKTLTFVSYKELKNPKDTNLTKSQIAKQAGKLLAQKALKLKINQVVFDRNGYRYHGRVKAFAEGVKEGGLLL